MIVNLKSCPRCGGDLAPDADDPARWVCLQCGRALAGAAPAGQPSGPLLRRCLMRGTGRPGKPKARY